MEAIAVLSGLTPRFSTHFPKGIYSPKGTRSDLSFMAFIAADPSGANVIAADVL